MDGIEQFLTTRPFFDAFRGESDRACAVLAGAFLDSLLERLLRRAIVQNAPSSIFDGQGPLATFSAKIDMAYSLGFLPNPEHRDLNIIRKIRNDFAHAVDHDPSFSTNSVADRTQSLLTLTFLVENNHMATTPIPEAELQLIVGNPRRRFEVAVAILTANLYEIIQKMTMPTVPEGLIRPKPCAEEEKSDEVK